MRSVLVTGATQPLGRAVIDALLAGGVETVTATGIEPRPDLPEPVIYEAADLSHSRPVRRLLNGICRDNQVDCIIHLAFHRTPGARRSEQLHVDATRLLMRLAEQHRSIDSFVYRSGAEVYAARRDRPDLLREDNPINMSTSAPSWVRQRVSADLALCNRMGMAEVNVAVLRCAEILAPDCGSQLWDYLDAKLCLRPMGFDPILNVLSLHDAARAFAAAALGKHSGVFNIPGLDTLPLSTLIRRWGRDEIPMPGPLLGPWYRARGAVLGKDFRYEPNRWRFHFNGVLDGDRAERVLGYVPERSVDWPT